MFIDSVRSQEKKEVIRLVENDFLDEIRESGIVVHHSPITIEEIEKSFSDNAIPIILISSYRIYKQKFPHWVVVTGHDDQFIYVHDPYVDAEINKEPFDCVNMPIPKNEFARMCRYGKSGQRAAILIYSKKERNTV